MRWNEFVLTVRNDGGQRIIVRTIGLESENLPLGVHTVHQHLLEKATNENVRVLQTNLPALRTDLGGERALECDPDDMSYRTKRVVIGTLFTVLSLGRAGLTPWDLSCANDDSLRRRGFDLPLPLDPAKAVTRSAFFPLTPAPTVLRVHYEVGGAEKSLGVGLMPLSRMHVVGDAAAR